MTTIPKFPGLLFDGPTEHHVHDDDGQQAVYRYHARSHVEGRGRVTVTIDIDRDLADSMSADTLAVVLTHDALDMIYRELDDEAENRPEGGG